MKHIYSSFFLFIGIAVVVFGFTYIPARAWCVFGVIGDTCGQYPVAPPPPGSTINPSPPPSTPPVPEITVTCDGKNLSFFESRKEIPCTDINNLKRGEVFTITGRNFFPKSKYTTYGFRNSAGSSPGGSMFPYSTKPGDVFLNADSSGSFVAIADVPDFAFGTSPFYPYGTYPFHISMVHYDSKKGNVTETAKVNLNIVAKTPPSTPPTSEPQPKPISIPPRLPSGGACNTSGGSHAFRVCYFDGVNPPSDNALTLAQGDEQGAFFSENPVGSWKGFFHNWGTGKVANSEKSTQVSAMWRGNINFKEGTYIFHTKSDDGIELTVDGNPIITNWNDHSVAQNDSSPVTLSEGAHLVVLRWYQNGGEAAVGLSWDFVPPVPHVLGVDPKKVRPGEIVTVTSWPGFTNNTRVNVYFDNDRITSLYLDPLDPPQLKIPDTTLNGTRVIKITPFDGLGKSLSATIEVYGGRSQAEPTIIIERALVSPGDTVTVKGFGWFVGEKTLFMQDVAQKRIEFAMVENRCPQWTTVCGGDEIFYGVKIPKNIEAGTYYIVASGQKDQKAITLVTVVVEKKIEKEQTKPTITLRPVSGPAGTTVTVVGGGFVGRSKLQGEFRSNIKTLGDVLTDESGSFTTTFQVPQDVSLGSHVVRFTTVAQAARINGSYRCSQSSNMQNCRTLPPIVLKTNGEYSNSSENGTYIIAKSPLGNTITFSESKIRGIGLFTQDYLQISFSYVYNGRMQNMTYLWEDLANPPVVASTVEQSAKAEFVVTEVKKIEEQKDDEAKEHSKKNVDTEEDKEKSQRENKEVGQPTKKYGDSETKVYNTTSSRQFGDLVTPEYGTIDTRSYGDVLIQPFGGVLIPGYGNVVPPSYGDVQAPSYGEGVPTRSYGEVQTPSFDAPPTTPSGCNQNIPTYSQPPECRTRSSIEKGHYTANFFNSVGNFFGRIFKWVTGGSRPKNVPQQDLRQVQPVPVEEDSAKESLSNVVPKTSPAEKQSQSPQSSKIAPKSSASTPRPDLAGSYRCYSYNVSGGGGGNCRLFAPIILKADGTYSVSSEQGTYRVEGDTIILSESKLRGPGTLLEDNLQMRFEYDYNGWHHVITYLKESLEPTSSPTVSSKNASIEITLHITFPEGDYLADNINTITLVDKESGKQVAQSLAYAIDRQTLESWFGKRPPKEGVSVGRVYNVLGSSGFGDYKVGELDLAGVSDGATVTISGSSQ